MIAIVREAIVQMIHELRDPLAGIEARDAALGRRVRRAAATAARNVGATAADDAGVRYRAALASLEELDSCLREAEANEGASTALAPVRSQARRAAEGLRTVI